MLKLLTMKKLNKKIIIIKYTIFFAILLPIIQGTQLYVLFNVFNPILLIMPITMGSITGFLVGYNRYNVLLQISKLKNIRDNLKIQVIEQTKELEEKNKTLNNLLLIDPLTKLGNRIKLKELFVQEKENIGNQYKNLSLLMIDIDYFKKYNDYYGHLKGDEVLIKLGEFFSQKESGTNHKAVRFGGEEFIIILPNCDKEEAKIIAQDYVNGVKALNIEHIKSEEYKKVTLSIGVHTSDKINSSENTECIKKADEALYLAKEQGRNRFKHSEEII